MPRFHETQIGKARKIAGFTISMVASAMILIAGSLKISGAAVMQHNMAKITHFGDKVWACLEKMDTNLGSFAFV